MRAVKTVIEAAGLNKHLYPDLEEDQILLRTPAESNQIERISSVTALALHTSSLHLLLRAFSIAPFGHDTEQIRTKLEHALANA